MAPITDSTPRIILQDYLDVGELASAVHAGQAVVHYVVEAVQHAIYQPSIYTEESDTVITIVLPCSDKSVKLELDVTKLAADCSTTTDAIHRILAGITGRVAESRGNHDQTNHQTIPPRLQLTLDTKPVATTATPKSYLKNIPWPADIPAHATVLMKGLATIADNNEGHKDISISREDFRTLETGAQLLAAKAAVVWTNLLNKGPGEEMQGYNKADWYLPGHILRKDGQEEADGDELPELGKPGLFVDSGPAKAGSREIPHNLPRLIELDDDEEPPPLLSNSSPMRAPHLRVVSGCARSVIKSPSMAAFTPRSTTQATNGSLTIRRSLHQNSAEKIEPGTMQTGTRAITAPGITSDQPYRMPTFRQMQRERTPKHAIVHIPGSSPEKKKTKPTFRIAEDNEIIAKKKEPVRPRNSFVIFSMAARDVFHTQFPGITYIEMQNKITIAWKVLTDEEKKKYNPLVEWDKMRFYRQVTEGGGVDQSQRDQDLSVLKTGALEIFNGLADTLADYGDEDAANALLELAYGKETGRETAMSTPTPAAMVVHEKKLYAREIENSAEPDIPAKITRPNHANVLAKSIPLKEVSNTYHNRTSACKLSKPLLLSRSSSPSSSAGMRLFPPNTSKMPPSDISKMLPPGNSITRPLSANLSRSSSIASSQPPRPSSTLPPLSKHGRLRNTEQAGLRMKEMIANLKAADQRSNRADNPIDLTDD